MTLTARNSWGPGWSSMAPFQGASAEKGALLANGTEVGPVPVVPDEPAGLREDATLALLDVHGPELHRAGGVEEPAVARFQDGQAGPLQGRVEAEGPRTAGRVPGAQEVTGVP